MKLNLKKIICFLVGHQKDWDEYNTRIEKEAHHASADMVYCSRCNEFTRIDYD